MGVQGGIMKLFVTITLLWEAEARQQAAADMSCPSILV